MALGRKPAPKPDDAMVALLTEIREELRALRREARFNAVLGGILAKRGPQDGEGRPSAGIVKMAADMTKLVGD